MKYRKLSLDLEASGLPIYTVGEEGKHESNCL